MSRIIKILFKSMKIIKLYIKFIVKSLNDKFAYLTEIGEGKFAIVFSGLNKTNNELIAVKVSN